MNDEATIEKLVNENLKLAHYFAGQYEYKLSRWMDKDEITSNAMLGLFDAAATFDTSKNYKFSPWAKIHIHKRVMRPMVDKARVKRGGICAELNHVHLDEINEDGENIWHNTIAEDNKFDNDQSDHVKHFLPIVSEFIGKLRPRHRLIVLMRFGLIDGELKTLEETAVFLGLTRERVRQMERDAMMALKEMMKKEDKPTTFTEILP